MRHLRGKRLLPKVFKDQNHIDEIKGIYVPFWLFDTDADADIRYRATKVRSWSDKNYNYTETRFFMVARSGNIGFTRVPVDGSTKMEDDLMESIEPFDFKEAVPFQTAYLAGYMADKYDVGAEESIARANERVKRSTEDNFKSTVTGYTSVTTEQSSVRLHDGSAKYALYPVWILNTTWNGKQYRFAMNGQSGKFVGDLPVDKRQQNLDDRAFRSVCNSSLWCQLAFMAGTDHIEGGVEKMKRTGRKLIGMAAAVLLMASAFCTAVYAADGFSSEYERLLDTAYILSDAEADEITGLLDELSERQKMDVTIATVNNLDGYNSIEACADDLYDYCNFGYGADRDGLMFLVSMEEREWHISTCGYGITAFTDAGIQYVGGQMLDSLADGDYAEAFRIYAACCDDLIDQARAGHPFDEDDVPRKPMSLIVPLVCIVIGAALGIAVVQGMKAQLKSVRKEKSAANYVRPGSMNLTGKQDLFLYSNVNRVKRETKSSSSGGGGSSTHRSSSGTTHGGGGGKF